MSQLKQPHERIDRMTDVKELLHSNLHEVFSERDPERRRAAIERTYTEDVTFIDPEGAFVGRPGSEASRWRPGGLRVRGGRAPIRWDRHRRAGVAVGAAR